jgi:hypothetical protein
MIGFSGGDTNLYRAEAGNPINGLDPSGNIVFVQSRAPNGSFPGSGELYQMIANLANENGVNIQLENKDEPFAVHGNTEKGIYWMLWDPGVKKAMEELLANHRDKIHPDMIDLMEAALGKRDVNIGMGPQGLGAQGLSRVADAMSGNFEGAARRNGVPDWVIAEMIQIAAQLDVGPRPGKYGANHKYCFDWAAGYELAMRLRLREMGFFGGLMEASAGGIVRLRTKIWHVSRGPFYPAEQHTGYEITLRDGSVWYVDCGTLSTGDVTNLRGPSNFTSAMKVPSDWVDADEKAKAEKRFKETGPPRPPLR